MAKICEPDQNNTKPNHLYGKEQGVCQLLSHGTIQGQNDNTSDSVMKQAGCGTL